MQSLLNELSLMFKWLVLIYVRLRVQSVEWHNGDSLLKIAFGGKLSRNRTAWRKSRIKFGFWGEENANQSCTFEVSCVIARSNFTPPPVRASTRFRVMASPYVTSRLHSLDTPHSLGLLWTSDQPDAGTEVTLRRNSWQTVICTVWEQGYGESGISVKVECTCK